jgi:hypothetical protein
MRKDFSSSLCVHTGFGAHPVSCTMGTGSPFQGEAQPGRDADHSPPSSAEVENKVYSSPPKRLHGVQWDSFSFSFSILVTSKRRKQLQITALLS